MKRDDASAVAPAQVLSLLRERYAPDLGPARDPFAVLVATVLSHRTKDERAYEAAVRLLARHPDAASLARAQPKALEPLLPGVGFPRQKARALVRLAGQLLERHAGEVPREPAALLALAHVGRKTMNCVRVYAFHEAVVPVDTHVHRIANRLGWVTTDHPEATEAPLADLLDARDRREVNELLVRFGREVCRPTAPRCGGCPFSKSCPSARAGPDEELMWQEGPTMLARVAAGAHLSDQRSTVAGSASRRRPS